MQIEAGHLTGGFIAGFLREANLSEFLGQRNANALQQFLICLLGEFLFRIEHIESMDVCGIHMPVPDARQQKHAVPSFRC